MGTGQRLAQVYAALVSAQPAELLGPLVQASGGALLEAAREDVVYRPGRDTSLRFAASVRRDGVVGREGWVVHAADELPAGTLALDGPAGRVAAWRVRDDPALPGLRSALDRTAVAELLADLGLPPDGLVLELLAYRPQRRAVVAATTPTSKVFVKCVLPATVAGLHARHAAFRAVDVPVPAPLGYDADLGLLVLTPLPGDALRPALLAPTAALPDPGSLAQLLERFARVELDEPARSPLRQAPGHAALLRTVLPAAADRIDELLGEVEAAAADHDQQVVHGDFYDAQLLVRDAQVVGVVDVDGAGRGHPADDAANLLAHLHVLAQLAPGGAGVHTWLPAVAARLAPQVDPDQLRRRTAAVLLGLATWPHSSRTEGWQQRTYDLLDLTRRVLHGAT